MRRRITSINVNMFPFLSVLCSVIGVLMLFMLSIISTRIVGAGGHTPVSPAVGRGPGELTDQEFRAIQAEVERMSNELSERRRHVARLVDQRDELRRLLELKQKQEESGGDGELLHGVDIAERPAYQLIPARGVSTPKRPRFVEVDFAGYIVHPGEKRFAVSQLPGPESEIKREGPPTTPMEQFLQQAHAERDSEYLIFLIRPDGAPAFDRVKRYLVQKYPHQDPRSRGALSEVDMGWEPFAEEWLVHAETDANR